MLKIIVGSDMFVKFNRREGIKTGVGSELPKNLLISVMNEKRDIVVKY